MSKVCAQQVDTPLLCNLTNPAIGAATVVRAAISSIAQVQQFVKRKIKEKKINFFS